MSIPQRLVRLVILIACAFAAPSCPAQQASVDPELSKTVQQAQTLIASGDFAAAVKILEPATEKFADKPVTRYLLAYALHAEKQYDEALRHYEITKTFVNLKPQSLYNIACIYSLTGKTDEAFAAIDAAIQAGFSDLAQLQADSDFAKLKNDPRFAKYQPKMLSDEELFIEKTRILHQWSGETAGDQFGWTARRVGDIDSDSVTDFVATAPTYDGDAGKIYVYSSKSGKLLHSVTGKAGQRLGNSAVGIGDVNGDGIADIIAGAPGAGGTGAAYVYSGKDMEVIHSLHGNTQSGQFGYEVSEAGDIDGDGVPDFLVGELAGTGKVAKAGRVVVYSGKSAQPIFELGGQRQGDNFGNAAALTKIADQSFLLAIGAPNAGPGSRGEVFVYEVNDSEPTFRFKIESNKHSVNLGQMFISFPGDLDRDGTPDVYASDFSDNSVSKGGGKVVIHSGANGQELLAIAGAVAGEGLGTSPSDAGDVDGDGIGDLVVGAWQNAEGARSGGKVYLYSAADEGKLLRTWTCKQSGDTLGFDACGIGDVDGDGNVDFLLTSAWSNVQGAKSGRVFIVAGENYEPANTQSSLDGNSNTKLIAGEVTTLLDNLDGGTGGLEIDAAGNLYSADFGSRLDGGGTVGNQLYKISPNGDAELFFDQLQGGSGSRFDSDGNLFQSSIRGGFVSRISPAGEATVFSRGFAAPVGLAFNQQQDLFVCNCGSNTISKVTRDGVVSVYCDSPFLKCPNGIAAGPDGTLYVCNFGNGDVLKIDKLGNATRLATLPGNNNGHLIYHRGYLYVLARMDCRAYRVDLAGRFEPLVGTGQRGKTDGRALESSLSLPNSLVISPDEKWLYINETSPIEGPHENLSPTRIRRVAVVIAEDTKPLDK